MCGDAWPLRSRRYATVLEPTPGSRPGHAGGAAGGEEGLRSRRRRAGAQGVRELALPQGH